MKTTPLALGCAVLFAVGSICLSQAASESEPNIADQVQGKAVFPTPFGWIGTAAPPENESAALLDAATVFDTSGASAGMGALERFLESYPRSVWAPSVRLGMALAYQSQCRYSQALAHFEQVWTQTAGDPDPAARESAASTAASWAYLLGCLGHQE